MAATTKERKTQTTARRKTASARPAVEKSSKDGLHHQQGCPAVKERIEIYTNRRPDGTPVRVTRCTDCAAGVVVDIDESELDHEGEV